MATWQDGPEYAPLERPDEFSMPEVAPLETAPAPAAQPPAPAERPGFDGPSAPVAPLETLVPVPGDQRDPERPFDVVSSNLTAPGAWAGVHGSAPHEVTPQPAAPGPWPLPGWTYGNPGTAHAAPGLPSAPSYPGAPAHLGAPALPAGQPSPSDAHRGAGYPGAASPGQLPSQNAFPVPGTPEWFGPGASGEQPPAPGRLDARQVLDAVTPGLLICLGLGVVIRPLAPILVVVAFVLCRRVRVAQVQVRRTFAVGLGSLVALALSGLLSGPLSFAHWWDVLSGWSRLTCLVTAVVATIQVWARLRSRATRPDPPPPSASRGPWS